MSAANVIHGDCIEVMRSLPDNSVDAVVTDPPYGLGFMGKEWDDLPPGEEWAAECLRVLKPGGHLLAFGGTRTWHRLACAVEDAGFEVRDSIAWLYGSGFPKSLDVSKAIDKAGPNVGSVPFGEFGKHYSERRRATGLTHAQVCAAVGAHGAVNHGGSSVNWEKGYSLPTVVQWEALLPLLDLDEVWKVAVREEYEREVIGTRTTGIGTGRGSVSVIGDGNRDITAPATDASRTWQGWGTAMKPAFEPIVVARKPLVGTVAANVFAHGTGALNIDGCRIGTGDNLGRPQGTMPQPMDWGNRSPGETFTTEGNPAGRWPANVVLDESQAAALDAQSGTSASRVGKPRGAASGDGWGMTATGAEYDDKGGASRFFYVAKAPKSERVRTEDVAHPTVKPLTLMRWLVRLVTPPGGTVLEPFAGSGTTVEACLLEGFDCIAIEREADYLPLIQQRIERARTAPSTEPTLFDEVTA